MRKPLPRNLPARPVRSGEPVSISAATLPCDSTPRSVRATTERQYVQMTTTDEPIANSTGAPHDGQLAMLTLPAPPPAREPRSRREAPPAVQPTATHRAAGSNRD